MLYPGKSPLFEVRQMDEEANNSMKSSLRIQKDLVEDSILVSNQIENAKKLLDDEDEDEDYSPKTKKLGTVRYAEKRRSPLYVYTFKVDYAHFLPSRCFILLFISKVFEI